MASYDRVLRDLDKLSRDIKKVLDNIVGIESRLSEQIKAAIEKRDYSDLAGLAKISEKVHEAIGQIRQQVDASAQPAAAPAPRRAAKGRKPAKAPKAAKAAAAKPAAAAAPAAKRQVGGKRGYPKFAKAGNKLVEVKWNSKKNGEQRHRMDFGTVNLFVKAINRNGDKLFRKNLLTEVTNQEGKRLPLHQVYSVLGWLLSGKAITKQGRGDYRPNAAKLSPSALKETFSALPDEGTAKRVVAKKKK